VLLGLIFFILNLFQARHAMEDLNSRMDALSLHTSSTDSLLARVARLPVDVLDLIYKQFVRDFLFKRARARETIGKNLLYLSGGMFGQAPRWRVGNPNRSRWRWKRSVRHIRYNIRLQCCTLVGVVETSHAWPPDCPFKS
jgi:hypothetical protein